MLTTGRLTGMNNKLGGDKVKPRFYAAFDEGRGVVIGVTGERSEPIMWFKSVDEFDRFFSMLRKFRGTISCVPEVFRKAFEED